MSAYMIADVDITDVAAFGEYVAKVAPLVQKHGGEYLVRGQQSVILEGNWKPSRLVVLRFPDMASVQRFFDDPEYQPLKALRHRAAKTNMVAAEAV